MKGNSFCGRVIARIVFSIVATVVAYGPLFATGAGPIPAGARVFVEAMDGFGAYLTSALAKKQAPVIVVTDREKAEFIISGAAESQKASWSKILFTGNAQSREEASINVVDVKTGEVVFAYNVNKQSAARGRQSTAESCAKHFKEFMEGK